MKSLRNSLLLISVLVVAGCVTVQPLPPSEVSRLIDRPDFKDAKSAAPAWAEDALRTLNRIENERNQLLNR